MLEFSFIGYSKQQVSVGNQSTINVILQEEYIGLNELVVVGYGTVKKKDLTGSVSSIKIALRGNRSINASNTPLFLVDGIEYGSTLDLNASDIQSIEVLKDALSIAIYGTRGANGVVIITTKKGTAAAGKTKVSMI